MLLLYSHILSDFGSSLTLNILCSGLIPSTYLGPVRQREHNFLLCGESEKYFGSVGRSVGKIIVMIILSFRVGTSKNKSIDHRVKEISAIMSTQVTYETWHIFVFCVFYCNPEAKNHIRKNINNKKCLYVKSALLF